MIGAAAQPQLPYWRREFVDRILREVPLQGNVVLEAGCGDGALTRLIAQRGGGAFTVGVDLCCSFSEGTGFATVPMSLNELDFPDSYFDVVFSQNVLEHVHGLDQAWAEIKRVLKPGGTFFCHFGPLWSHAFGHHWYHETDDSFSSLVPPYAHLILPRKELLQIARRGTKLLTPERAAAKEYLLGAACNKLFPADYRRIFRDNLDFHIAEWVEVCDDRNPPLPEEVLRKYPQVQRQDFDVGALWIKGTKVGGKPALSPGVRNVATRPRRPSLMRRLIRKPRKLLSRV